MGNCVSRAEKKADFTPRSITESRAPAKVAIPVLIAAAFLIFPRVAAFPQRTAAGEGLSPDQFLRKAIDSELKAQDNDHTHWMYQLKAGESGNEEVKWVIETRDGDLERLQSVNGKLITPEQEKQESRRIERLLHKNDEQKKRRRAQQEDDRTTEHLFRMLPDAVLASYGERKGDLVEILFRPNPNFRPLSHEDVVFHSMEGHIWINQKEKRLAEIDGHLIKTVKFFGGLLGYLDEGGQFHVQQSEVAPGHWEITLLHVDMRGKALFFKTVSVQQNEIRTNFRRITDNLTLAEAAEELQKQCTANSAANGRTQNSFVSGVKSASSPHSDRSNEAQQ
jgi:hypothetical protein